MDFTSSANFTKMRDTRFFVRNTVSWGETIFLTRKSRFSVEKFGVSYIQVNQIALQEPSLEEKYKKPMNPVQRACEIRMTDNY